MLQSGTVLGDRYTLLEPVARGGMGEVWRAEDTVLGRTVALKTLLPNLSGRPDFAARFQAEARAMAALSDPGIVEIYDYGQSGGLAFLVMRFVDGESLQRRLRRDGPMPPSEAMTLVAQAGTALQAAHDQGIVHRDVKPSNLILRPDGRLMLTDFGIAQLIAGDRRTEAGAVTGTAEYLSPEQVNGAPVTPSTDVYALGVVAYEMLTRSRPFEADTPVAVALKHAREQPPPLPAGIPPAVRHVVMRALAKDPAQRWPSAADMARAATLAAEARPAAARRPWGRTGIAVAAAAVILLTAAALVAGRGPAGGGDGVFGSGVLRIPGFGGAPGQTATGTSPGRGTGSGGPAAGPSGGVGPNAVPIATGPGPTGTGGPPGPPTVTPTVSVTTSSPAPIPDPTTTPPDQKPGVVPDVVGMAEATARLTITNAGLTPQVRYGTATGPCVVLSQFPNAGTQVQPATVVGIELPRPTGECAILN